MPLRSAAALLALLLVAFAAAAAFAAPPKHAAPAAKPAAAADPTLALIDQVTERYLTLQQYQMTGRFTARITGGKLDGNVVEVPFFYAAVRPGKLRNDLRNPVMTTLVVSNGDSLQMYVPGLHQYTRQPAPSVLPGGASNDAFTRSLDPLLAYALRAPGQPFASARSLGRDTVHVESGTSLLPPILLLLAAVYCWLWFRLSQLRLEEDRPTTLRHRA